MIVTLDLYLLIQTHRNSTPQSGAYHALLQQIVPPFLKLLLEQTHGNKSAAARIAGLNRSTLNRKISQHQIRLETTAHLHTQEKF